jgi:hypothetical protein
MTLKYEQWRKSRHSAPDSQCVEVAQAADEAIGVRDSKQPDGAVLEFSAAEWGIFLRQLKHRT